jgi:hypothetical protein
VQLVDADQVARGIAEGAVANRVRLLGRLLDDFGAAGLQALEGAVEVGGGQNEVGVSALEFAWSWPQRAATAEPGLHPQQVRAAAELLRIPYYASENALTVVKLGCSSSRPRPPG